MKKCLALVLTLALCLAMAVPAMAAGSGMENFRKSDTYAGQFTDMPDSYWGTQWAAACYEYGLMKGKTADTFVPQGNLSIAEAIVMADRIHEIYTTGESTLTNGSPWYQPYVDYAIANGFIYAESFTDYTADAPRYLMAQLLYLALPEEELATINAVTDVPDVPEDWIYAPAIYTLYQAGVLTGNDSYGSFAPEKSITRAEAAAVLARLAVPALRQKVTLMKEFAMSAGDTTLITFDFPQANLISPDGLEYIYVDVEGDSLLSLLFAAEPVEGVAGAGISAFISPEEVTQLVTPAFEGAQFSTSLLYYGDLDVYLTEMLPGSQWESYDRLYALNFLWEENLISVYVVGQNCDDLFQQVFDSLEILGSLRTAG